MQLFSKESPTTNEVASNSRKDLYMLTQIELLNYKSYRDSIIDFKPITILCGGNSSGKTAIIKSILLMKQSFEATGSNYLLINGAYTNNGLYANIRRTQPKATDDSKMGISVSFIVDKDSPSYKDICRSIGMLRRKNEFKNFVIHASFQFNENPTIPQVGEIESSTITLVSNYANNAAFYSDASVASRIHMRRGSYSQQYTTTLEHFPIPLYSKEKSEYPFDYSDQSWGECTCYFRGMQLVSLYRDQLSKKSTSALPVLYTIFRILASEFDKIEYIGPLRETPLRQYFLQDVYSAIGVKGENTAQYLGQFGSTKIQTPLPNSPGPQVVSLNEAVSQWASFLGIEQVSVNTNNIPGAKITQIMIGEQNIVDVGFGVSQVLPILVEGLTMAKGNTLILEQPEIHLHPKMQMDIADFLVMIAQQDKHLIVETHSDHIINRLVRRALEDQSLKERIGIYFIEKADDGTSKLTEVHIDENLGIDEAPQGFFDQYASETEQILQAGYKNMKTKRGGRQ